MSEPSGRFLIAKVVPTKTQGGRPVAHLYSTDTRLRYPVLTLFDLSMLETVGIDPNDLSQTVHKRFWAFYVDSNKLNQHGNPYRDVLNLEPIDSPATSSSIDGAAILGELRAIKALLLEFTAYLSELFEDKK